MTIDETKVRTTERMTCGCRWVEPISAPKGKTVAATVEAMGGFVPCEHHEHTRDMKFRKQAAALVRRQNEHAARLARAARGA